MAELQNKEKDVLGNAFYGWECKARRGQGDGGGMARDVTRRR